MSARTLLFVAGIAFGVSAFAGIAVMRWWPTGATVGSVALALAFCAACLHLALTTPRAGAACHGCGRERDASLPFCARCGAA